jgi:MFS family permease
LLCFRYYLPIRAYPQGVATFFWMPLVNKYGRRPIYIIGFVGYTMCAIWVAVSSTYGSHLAGRILLGFFSSTGECLAPLTIADMYVLHHGLC